VPAIIKSHGGYLPQWDEGVFLADGAVLVGHVELSAHANIWYGAVLRGDCGRIRVGQYSTIQDLACLHMSRGGSQLEIGSYVSIGHGAIIHGAHIEDGVYVGAGSIVMDGARIGAQAVLLAGSMVPRGASIPPRCLARGRPARVVRELRPEELQMGKKEAELQLELARSAD
jgi:gamma-carbonic anhydrase